MKVAHLAVITPNRCGLYETTRELVTNLRKCGVDSRLVDPKKEENKLYPGGESDRGAPFADIEWAKSADILVNHSGLGEDLERTEQPTLLVAHGRPKSSFISEATGSTPIFSYHYQLNKTDRLKGVVTFWPEHDPYLRVMFSNKPVFIVPAFVDLDRWKPQKSNYSFHGNKGRINVVLTDAWRDDIDPFVPLNAYALWARTNPGAKLHVYARPKDKKRGWDALFHRMKEDGTLGEVRGWIKGLEHVYNAADFALTANGIDVRTVREAMACGCPVIKVRNDLNKFYSDVQKARSESRESVRERAERLFNPMSSAKEFKRVLDAIY